MRIPTLLLLVFAPPLAARAAAPGPGSTRAEVIQAYGEPVAALKLGREEDLTYPAGEIRLRDGRVADMPSGFAEKQAEAARRQASGLVLLDGKWVTPEEKREQAAAERQRFEQRRLAANAAAAGGVRVIKEGGRRIDLAALLPRGKVTVVDFYADWCGPCRTIAPHLETLARENPGIAVVKVDIVNWDTPVARQFNLRAIPHMQVYDAGGKPVGKPGSSFAAIRDTALRAAAAR